MTKTTFCIELVVMVGSVPAHVNCTVPVQYEWYPPCDVQNPLAKNVRMRRNSSTLQVSQKKRTYEHRKKILYDYAERDDTSMCVENSNSKNNYLNICVHSRDYVFFLQHPNVIFNYCRPDDIMQE